MFLESLCFGCRKRQGRSEDVAVVRFLQDFSHETRGGDSLGRQAHRTQGASRYVDAG